jgi:hypothetical protein
MKKYGNLMLASLGVRGSFQLRNPRVELFLAKVAADHVTQINTLTRDLLRQNLVEAQAGGESIKQVLERIRDVFDGGLSSMRANRIARTEIVTLTNTSRHEAARQSGVVQKKRWISALIPTTRKEPDGANHADMHGIEVDFDQPFLVKNRAGSEDRMDSPGDLSASPENVVNCICIASYFSGTEEFRDLILPVE